MAELRREPWFCGAVATERVQEVNSLRFSYHFGSTRALCFDGCFLFIPTSSFPTSSFLTRASKTLRTDCPGSFLVRYSNNPKVAVKCVVPLPSAFGPAFFFFFCVFTSESFPSSFLSFLSFSLHSFFFFFLLPLPSSFSFFFLPSV
jgi:hypothetical protein